MDRRKAAAVGAAVAACTVFVLAVPKSGCSCTPHSFPPSATALPSASGTLSAGSVLTCNSGTWVQNGSGFALTYQWQSSSDGGSTWANIGGATGNTYVIGSGDVGNLLRCNQTGTNVTGATLVSTVAVGPATSGSTANIFVSTVGGGSCTRSGSLLSFNQGTSCSSMNNALQKMQNGDLALVQCGSYGQQILTPNASLTANVTFQPVTALCATIQSATVGSQQASLMFGAVSGAGPDWITVANFVINSPTVGISESAVNDTGSITNLATHITMTGNQINVGHVTGGPNVSFHAIQFLSFTSNTIGPSIPLSVSCSPGCGSPEGFRIGKPSSASPASCSNQACNATIDSNLIQYTTRDCTMWPTSGFGSCPGVSCPNANGCHSDGIHIWGCSTCAVTNNVLNGIECQGIFFEPTNNSLNSDITVTGNAVASVSSCAKGIYLNMNGSAVEDSGTWTVAFNASPSIIDLQGFTGDMPGTVLNLIGNYGKLFLSNTLGNAINCTTAPNANTTINYYYNAWTASSTGSGPGPGGACGLNDQTGVSTPAWTNNILNTANPNVGISLVPTGADGTGDDLVVTSVPGGCPTDLTGQTRPFGNANCDAGPYER